MLSPPAKLTPCAVAIQWCAFGLPAGVQYIRWPWEPAGLAHSTILALAPSSGAQYVPELVPVHRCERRPGVKRVAEMDVKL
jgi:hypothetical protein